MPKPGKSALNALLLLAATASLLTTGCVSRVRPGDGDDVMAPAGEPEQYSATLVRTVEDGARRETRISREARSGDQRREEWTERGQNRALIWRPDLGKCFLLDLDGRAYVEHDLAVSIVGTSNSLDTFNAGKSGGFDAGDGAVQAIDQYFDDRRPPSRVEMLTLPQALIDGHLCAVYEHRAIFADGHVETTRRFQARDLSGLALKVESEAERGSAKVTTERREVRTEVAPDMFVVPADFKRVDKLPR